MLPDVVELVVVIVDALVATKANPVEPVLVFPELVVTVAVTVTESAEVTVGVMVFEVGLVVWTAEGLDPDASLVITMFSLDLLFVSRLGATEFFFLPAGLRSGDFDQDRVMGLVRGGVRCTAGMRLQA